MVKMGRIYIRRSKTNLDIWEVVGGYDITGKAHKIFRTQHKAKAQVVADARRKGRAARRSQRHKR